KKHTFTTDLRYDRNGVHFYGTDDTSDIIRDSLKQIFSGFSFSSSYYNHYRNKKDIAYRFDLDFYTLSDLLDNRENNIALNFFGKKRQENNDLIHLKVFVDQHFYKGMNIQDRTFVTLNPDYTIRNGKWNIKVGGKLSFENDSLFIHPDLNLSFAVFKKMLTYYAGWTGRNDPNSFKQLSDINPFLGSDLILKSSNIEHRYTGIRGTIKDEVYYDLSYSRKLINNLPFFINDSLTMNREFAVVYDSDATITNVHFELGYNLLDKLKLFMEFDQDKYVLDTLDRPWHTPTSKLSLGMHYNIQNKIYISAEGFYIGKTFAEVDGAEESLPEHVDLNFAINYKYLENLSFFFNIYNIFGSQYLRWYNYPSYGLKVMGGLAVSF
ncbi:MAG: hypothetical protein IIA45_07300, partial [Bacteroidetes bacterium]|nr:hypothetical protein [Bacteroidota bacterium]